MYGDKGWYILSLEKDNEKDIIQLMKQARAHNYELSAYTLRSHLGPVLSSVSFLIIYGHEQIVQGAPGESKFSIFSPITSGKFTEVNLSGGLTKNNHNIPIKPLLVELPR